MFIFRHKCGRNDGSSSTAAAAAVYFRMSYIFSVKCKYRRLVYCAIHPLPVVEVVIEALLLGSYSCNDAVLLLCWRLVVYDTLINCIVFRVMTSERHGRLTWANRPLFHVYCFKDNKYQLSYWIAGMTWGQSMLSLFVLVKVSPGGQMASVTQQFLLHLHDTMSAWSNSVSHA